MEGSTQHNCKSYAKQFCIWYEVVDVRLNAIKAPVENVLV